MRYFTPSYGTASLLKESREGEPVIKNVGNLFSFPFPSSATQNTSGCWELRPGPRSDCHQWSILCWGCNNCCESVWGKQSIRCHLICLYIESSSLPRPLFVTTPGWTSCDACDPRYIVTQQETGKIDFDCETGPRVLRCHSTLSSPASQEFIPHPAQLLSAGC